MPYDDPIDPIQARIAEAEQEIVLHETKIKEIRHELVELKIAQSVNRRFGINFNNQENISLSEEEISEETVDIEGKSKNLTMSDIVTEALGHIGDQGTQFASPQLIFSQIIKKYPNIKANHVKPVIWRMSKQGRLDRRENQYALPGTKPEM